LNAVWESRVAQMVQQEPKGRIFAAFNTNIDKVVHVTPEKMKVIIDSNPDIDWQRVESTSIADVGTVCSKETFFVVLQDRLSKGKSFHIVLENEELLTWLDRFFTDGVESMGGQAGISANQMAALDVESVVYTPLLAPKQANQFVATVRTPVIEGETPTLKLVTDAASPNDDVKINWIFEYGKGLTFEFPNGTFTTPRANRVILATRPPGSIMGFSKPMIDLLPRLGEMLNMAFMAGYHYADHVGADGRTFEEYMADTLRDLQLLRSKNPKLLIHYEYVPMKARELEPLMLKQISTGITSFGINENEIRRVLEDFDCQKEMEAISKRETAYTLYLGGLALLRHMQVQRIQIHNLGYYVVLLKKPYPIDPTKVREACLFGSSVNAIKAKYGGYVKLGQLGEAKELPLSDIGYEQLRIFASEAELPVPSNFLEEGIVELEDHYVLVVPAHVVPNPVSTVGMGDTISSCAYTAELI
jgi:ADP-dependent phosphofructokinase/glucokinase